MCAIRGARCFHGRPTIVFDFVGRKDAKTHGLAEDASKKLQGTLWVDEADRQVAHLDVSFDDNFRVAAGWWRRSRRDRTSGSTTGSGGRWRKLWLPTGSEATVLGRILLVKGQRQHFMEKDFDYKRFKVETEQGKDVPAAKPH